MKSGFTYSKTGDAKTDRAFDKVALAFANVDKGAPLSVALVNTGGDYQAVGTEDLFIASITSRIILPTPAGVPWRFSVKQTRAGTVTIVPASPTVAVLIGPDANRAVTRVVAAVASLQLVCKTAKVAAGAALARCHRQSDSR